MLRHWTKARIDKAKQDVRDELDRISPVVGSSERLRHALQRIKDLEDDLTPLGRLYCFIYLMSALVQHQRRPGLTQAQVAGLVERAHAILILQRIRPGVSRQSYLYGELHQVISLIERRSGRPWSAAWEQQIATHLSRPASSGGPGFEALALGGRALRLGLAAVAHRSFEEALGHSLSESQREVAMIGRIRALRLGGRLEDAAGKIATALAADDLSPGARREITWEKICHEAMQSGDLTPMFRSTSRKGSHHQASYVVEAYFWAACGPSRDELRERTRMRTAARDKKLRPGKLGEFFKAARVIEDCYDTEIPLPLRLQDLGKVLSTAKSQVNVDKELLVWGAATRWLVRIHSFHLAMLALKEYEALSIRLSGGASRDGLGCLQDLIDSPWLREAGWDDQSPSC